jgi:hypothetical protein
MGRLRDKLRNPFERRRQKGELIADHVAPCLEPMPLTREVRPRYTQPTLPPKPVHIDNGYWSQLMSRRHSAIDYSEVKAVDYDLLATGPILITSRRVPSGQAWYIDNLYFFARALGGFGTVLLPPEALMDYFVFTVSTPSSQMEYQSWRNLIQVNVDPVTSFPFLNDRIGPREAKFGITLYEGEYIQALYQLRVKSLADVIPYALKDIGFRFMGIQAAKEEIEAYLEEKL